MVSIKVPEVIEPFRASSRKCGRASIFVLVRVRSSQYSAAKSVAEWRVTLALHGIHDTGAHLYADRHGDFCLRF